MYRRREPLSAFTGMLSAIDWNRCPQSTGMPVRHHRNTQALCGIPTINMARGPDQGAPTDVSGVSALD